ncbi:MAG: NfeD family protein [Lachnospirales bacterium]
MSVWTYIWLAILIVSILVEAGTMGLVSIWFAAGALAAWALAMFEVSEWIQCLAFVLVSGLLLFFTRPLVKKYVTPKIQPTNVDAIIGREAVVSEAIRPLEGTGQVKVGGQIWSARTDEQTDCIPEGAIVTILRVEGVKLFVRPKQSSK